MVGRINKGTKQLETSYKHRPYDIALPRVPTCVAHIDMWMNVHFEGLGLRKSLGPVADEVVE